ncbi:MAG: polysaccharide biosynthesis C-terminal domain-containing protein [Lachnospiraceae bacterium]|nr:polysaccharide biosynthesis C-terminal domain-containing protein [Lachnospiraceae bacterium]
MPSNKKNDGMIMQAGILAVAGIIVRIIGLLYNSPMAAILGDEGIGYYNMAYNAYTIVLLISSYSIPSAISKVIAQKLAVKEYRNAHRIFKCALVYVLVVGGIASLFVFFGTGFLVQIEYAMLPLKVLAPTIFFSGILGVLRGYFQAHKSMVQTSVSQIAEQILNAAFSILMAYLLIKATSDKPESEMLSYGAAGGAIGTGVGVITALLFMLGIYALNRKTIMRRVERDKTPFDDSYAEILKMIFMVVTPFILSTFIYNANTFINQTIYQNIMIGERGLADTLVASQMGVVGKAVKISNIPIALASAMATAMIPGISGDFARKDLKGVRSKVAKAMKVTMLISIPAAVGIGVLAKPVMWVLYPQKESIDLASALLSVLAVSVIFYAMSTLSNAVLQSVGKLNSPVINAAIALAAQTGALIAMLKFLDQTYTPYYYIVAMVCYSLLVCILNAIAIRRSVQYKQEIGKTFIKPLLSAIVMGAVAFGIYQGLYLLTRINILALAVSVCIAVVVYFVLVIRMGTVTEEELRSMPKGTLLLRIAKKFHILKEQTQEEWRDEEPTYKKREIKKKNTKKKTDTLSKKKYKEQKKMRNTDIENRNVGRLKKDDISENDEDYWLDD